MSDKVFGVLDRSYKGKDGNQKKEELRVVLGEYNGKQFVSLRVFYQGIRDADQMFPDKAKGVTIKLKELRGVIEALEKIEANLSGVQPKEPARDLPPMNPFGDDQIPF